MISIFCRPGSLLMVMVTSQLALSPANGAVFAPVRQVDPIVSQVQVLKPEFALSSALMLAQQPILSAKEAANKVRRHTRGKILRVEDVGDSYQVRVLLPNGVVKRYRVDKQSGQIN